MKKLKFLAVTLLAVLSFGLTSCDKDKDFDYESITVKDGDVIISKHDFGTGDTAGYKLNWKLSIKGGNLVLDCLDSQPEFNMGGQASNLKTGGGISDIGEVKGISLIETKPADAAFSSQTAKAEKKHGYVVKVYGADETYPSAYEQNPSIRPPQAVYLRLWIKKVDDGSYEIRYEYPWK